MSSKLTAKPSKKERPRSSDKLKRGGKREGTPEKSTTPSQDALPEEGAGADKKPVLMNDEIRALQIKPENLEQLREPRPPSDRRRSPVIQPVVVRKLKPASEWDKPPPRYVTVAKPAPPDAPLKPTDYSNAAGLRFDEDGNIVPHSILGSVEDYKRAALETGDLPEELLRPGREDTCGDLTVKYERTPRRPHPVPRYQSVDESNALTNWQRRMGERRKQQDHLAKLLNKAPDRLVMNQADGYRKTQEQRYLIDRTIATMDYGKGYRIGSEFWQQQERIGDDLTGMHMTMTQTEKGYPPPIEHVGVPNVVHKEKGSDYDRPRTPFHKPWHKTPYLQQRRAQLQPVMTELDPYKPEVPGLQVVGSNKPASPPPGGHISEEGTTVYDDLRQEFMERENSEIYDPLSEHPDVYPAPVFGPSLRFAGQSARWTGDSSAFQDQAGIEARVAFEAYADDRVTSFLEIVNDGTTCIYYNWKKIPKIDPFEMMAAKVQRFYFNTGSGVILPGDTMKFPFVFKSPQAGVFSEQWTFNTTPVVCGGAALVVTLRGVALQKDKYKKQRTELEQELSRKQAEQIVSGVLDSLLDGIRSPDRPSSPLDAYITEEERFTSTNPELYYCAETVARLRSLYRSLFPAPGAPDEPEGAGPGDPGVEPSEGGGEGEEQAPGEGTTREEREEEVVEWDLSVENLKAHVMSLDDDDDQKQDLLQTLNLELLSLSFPPFSPRQQQMYNVGYLLLSEMVDAVTSESMSLRTALGMPEKEPDDIPDEPSDPKKKGQKDVKGDKDKKASAKDPKGAAGGKASAKEPARGGKMTPASGKRAVSRDKDRPASALSGVHSPIPEGGDPVLAAKYSEKLYTKSYELVCDTVDQMSIMFEAIIEGQGGPALPGLP